ncbi:hypothetical protein SSX86_026207 [Deinandra increscens subsp. villosa]|uniref:Prolamin-like domain-containing protein n=1 Tax=Deinandra increscens subsp. villosa TaxID=3103831 RepID=A0AAP0GPW3_9ASTR
MLILADQGPSPSPDFNPNWPRKANAIDCRAAYITVGDCYLETIRAYRTRQVRILIGPECCKAAQALNNGCWPNVLGFNPFFPLVLRSYCSAFRNGPLTTPFGAARAVEPKETGRSQASQREQ